MKHERKHENNILKWHKRVEANKLGLSNDGGGLEEDAVSDHLHRLTNSLH
jgi:hypothetical protein